MILIVGQILSTSKKNICLDAGMSLNKALYSLSYTCVTAGAGGILFAALYLLVRHGIFFYP